MSGSGCRGRVRRSGCEEGGIRSGSEMGGCLGVGMEEGYVGGVVRRDGIRSGWERCSVQNVVCKWLALCEMKLAIIGGKKQG